MADKCKHKEDPDLCEKCEVEMMGEEDALCPHDEDPDLCEECEAALMGDVDLEEDDEDEEPEPEPEPVKPEPEEKAKRGERKRGAPRQPSMSGHCSFPQTKEPHLSHERCAKNGSGDRAVPDKVFAPCPCPCHLKHTDVGERNPDGTVGEVEMYDCGGCGGVIAEAPVLGKDSDGDPIYVHINKHTGRMLYVECR